MRKGKIKHRTSKATIREKIDKKYRTNKDTISLNVEQFRGSAPFDPDDIFEPWQEVILNPRKHRK